MGKIDSFPEIIMIKNNCLPFFQRAGNLYTSLILIALTAFLLPSCKITKQSQYFETLQKKDTTLKGFITNDFESKIVAGDQISIVVSSLSPADDILFNNGAGIVNAGASSVQGYLVQEDGTIVLHRFGKMTVAGLSRRELAKQLEQKLLPYLKEPIVHINYLNHKITIIGDVVKPQTINLPDEQISLIDALVLSGDVLPSAEKKNITIIREDGNSKHVKHVNLEDHSIFSSPWYYVKPNDIILVSVDQGRYVKEEKRKQLQTTLALVATGVSLLLIVLDRVVKTGL